jgi:hypothetical protein
VSESIPNKIFTPNDRQLASLKRSPVVTCFYFGVRCCVCRKEIGYGNPIRSRKLQGKRRRICLGCAPRRFRPHPAGKEGE